MLQEVNPSLADAASVQQTVAVGCSLVRSALGQYILFLSLSLAIVFGSSFTSFVATQVKPFCDDVNTYTEL